MLFPEKNSVNTNFSKIKSFEKIGLWILLLTIAYFPLFNFLDQQEIRMWDESFYAISAFEMYQNHDFLVKHFLDSPSLYDLKPPLICWIQVLLFKTIGVNELAMRLPSALSGLFVFIFAIVFLTKRFKSRIWGILSGLIIITTIGFIDTHVTRTGDLDAPLALFIFLSVLCFFKYIADQQKGVKNLIFTSFFITLAVLTKGVGGLLFLPGMLLSLVLLGNVKILFSQKEFYFGIFILLFFVGGYYLGRELLSPGYIENVLSYEVTGRYLTIQDGHQHEFFWYFKNLFNWQFKPWVFLLPFSLTLTFIKRKTQEGRLIAYLLVVSISYLLIISFSQSKLEWYTASVLPILAIISAYPIFWVIDLFFKGVKTIKSQLWITLIIAVVFILPYKNINKKNINSNVNWSAEQFGGFIKYLEKTNPEINSFKIIHSGWNTHLIYYQEIYNKLHGYNIDYETVLNDPVKMEKRLSEVKTGDFIMSFQWEYIEKIWQKYHVELIKKQELLQLFKVGEPK